MARRTFILIPVFALLALAGAALAAEAPVAVSPGHVSKLAVVEARCPTFSWGEVEGAKSYELVVYRVGERGEEAQPLLRQSFPGSVESWTPDLASCLERGSQYAWSVRAISRRDSSAWSAPNLFEVKAGPSESEFEQALAVMERYLQERGVTIEQALRPRRSHDEQSIAPRAAALSPVTAASSVTEPLTLAAPDTVSLVTEGAVGVGTSAPLADLHVVGAPDSSAGLLVAAAGNQKSSEIFLAETQDGSYGMKLKYDGMANELQIIGVENSTIVDAFLRIKRSSGLILGDGSSLDGVVTDAELAAHVADAGAHHAQTQIVTQPIPGGTYDAAGYNWSAFCPAGTSLLGGGLAGDPCWVSDTRLPGGCSGESCLPFQNIFVEKRFDSPAGHIRCTLNYASVTDCECTAICR